jgi:hypothetical protein
MAYCDPEQGKAKEDIFEHPHVPDLIALIAALRCASVMVKVSASKLIAWAGAPMRKPFGVSQYN